MRAFLLLLVPLIVGLAACKEETKAPEILRPVLTTTVEPIATETFGPFASTVEARYQTQLGFQLAGRMVSREVYVGDIVKAGQKLAALDPTVTRFALTRARADVLDAKAQLANTEGVAARQETLATTGNAAQVVLDNAIAGRDTAKARLDQAEASLRMAEDQMGYTELRASFDGVVAAWTAEVGQYVSNGQAVVTVARPDIREAVVDIPDALIGTVEPGMSFLVRLQAAPAITASAIVREIGPLADAATRSRRVRLTLQSPASAFRIGTTITVAVEKAMQPRVMLPAQAVFEADGTAHVWVLASDGKHVTRRAVTLLAPAPPHDASDDVAVASGLSAGEKVVTVGVHGLRDGQAVAGEAGAGTTEIKRTRL